MIIDDLKTGSHEPAAGIVFSGGGGLLRSESAALESCGIHCASGVYSVAWMPFSILFMCLCIV